MLTEQGHLRSFRAVVCQTSMMEKEGHREMGVYCRGVTYIDYRISAEQREERGFESVMGSMD